MPLTVINQSLEEYLYIDGHKNMYILVKISLITSVTNKLIVLLNRFLTEKSHKEVRVDDKVLYYPHINTFVVTLHQWQLLTFKSRRGEESAVFF